MKKSEITPEDAREKASPFPSNRGNLIPSFSGNSRERRKEFPSNVRNAKHSVVATENVKNIFLAPLEKPKVFPEGIVEYFKKKFGDKIINPRVEKRKIGVKKNEQTIIWFRVEKSVFKDAVKHLCELQFPHLSVVSGNDIGENIELIYHFTVNYGEHLKEIPVNLSVEVPKNDLKIPSICDIIPGALITEREKQEMLGIKVEGIPDSRRIFLPDDFPENVYPWRKDEKGIPENMIKKLWEEKK